MGVKRMQISEAAVGVVVGVGKEKEEGFAPFRTSHFSFSLFLFPTKRLMLKPE